jgi:hypothetical protein
VASVSPLPLTEVREDAGFKAEVKAAAVEAKVECSERLANE